MFKNLKVVELREIARSRGLKGWYRLRKSDLISFIEEEEKYRELEKKEELDPEEEQKPKEKKEEKYHELDPEEEQKPKEKKEEKYHEPDPEEEQKPKEKKEELDLDLKEELEEKRKVKRRAKKARFRANRRARKEQALKEHNDLESMRLELKESQSKELMMEQMIKMMQESKSTNYFTLRYLLCLKGC